MTDSLDNSRVIVHLKHKTVFDVVLLHQFFLPLLCIHIHGTEFVDFKWLAILSHTNL